MIVFATALSLLAIRVLATCVLAICVLAIYLIATYVVPLIMAAIIRGLSPVHMLRAAGNERDFAARTGAVKAFLAGLADGVAAYDSKLRRSYAILTRFERPFYMEGACAGLTISCRLAPWRARKTLRTFWREHPQFVFLLIIGTGFSTGLQKFWTSGISASSIAKFEDRIDPLLRVLFFDGYAFQKFVFGFHKNPDLLSSGLNLEPAVRRGFYAGAGRALWFLVADFAAFESLISPLPEECRNECLAGYGLATGFAGCENVSSGSIATYPPAIAATLSFRLGLTTGLFARYYVDPEFVEKLLRERQPQLLDTVKDAAATYKEFKAETRTYEQWRHALELKLKNESEGAMAFARSVESVA
ncbi:MAG: DUF1702 family protein [Candidatus Sulfotelmatobacter sp.]